MTLFLGNWDGFRDNETDLWAFTWAAGTRVCDSNVVDFEDPHSHLADKSYWNHQGYASGLVLDEGEHFVTAQSLNEVCLIKSLHLFLLALQSRICLVNYTYVKPQSHWACYLNATKNTGDLQQPPCDQLGSI